MLLLHCCCCSVVVALLLWCCCSVVVVVAFSFCVVVVTDTLCMSPPHRYGLPVNFVSVVLKPHRKSHKKVSDALKDLYGYLDSKFVASEADVSLCE